MKSPGTLLRKAREERGLSLDNVAAMTRIPKPMLQHLEDDRFEEYFADVFVRGHLRSYAQELEVDVDEVLQAYERHTGRRRSEMASEGPSKEQSAPVAGRRTATSTPVGTNDVDGSTSPGSWSPSLGGLERSHLVGIALVLVGIFLMIGYLSTSQVTAQDSAEIEEAEEVDWGFEQDAETTRQLLDGTEADEESDDAAEGTGAD